MDAVSTEKSVSFHSTRNTYKYVDKYLGERVVQQQQKAGGTLDFHQLMFGTLDSDEEDDDEEDKNDDVDEEDDGEKSDVGSRKSVSIVYIYIYQLCDVLNFGIED